MEGKKISQMIEKKTVDGSEYIPIVDNNGNKKVNINLLKGKDGYNGKDGSDGTQLPDGILLAHYLDSSDNGKTKVLDQKITSDLIYELKLKYIKKSNNMSEDLILLIQNFFLDVFIKIGNNVLKVCLKRILYKKTIDGKIYTSINITETLTDGSTKGSILESKTKTGLEYLQCKSVCGSTLYFLINWDLFNTIEIQIDFPENTEFLDYAFNKHDGFILYNNLANLKNYDLMFIKNCQVVCTNFPKREDKGTSAKYALITMLTTMSKCLLRFIVTPEFTTTIISTNIKNNDLPIEAITKGSIHVCFHLDKVVFGIFKNYSWDTNEYRYTTPLKQGSEVIAGMEFIKPNKLRLFLPDGETKDFEIFQLFDFIGNVFIFEHYFRTLTSDIILPYKGITPITGAYCIGQNNGDILKDNFKRQDGPLGIAPTGLIYKCFTHYLIKNGGSKYFDYYAD